MRRHTFVCAIAIAGVLAWACSGGSKSVGPSGGGGEKVVVSPESTALVVGGTTTLTATAQDASGQPMTGVTFFWSSSDTGTAVVDQSGTVSSRRVGAAQIAASTEGISGVATVVVGAEPVKTVVVVPNSVTLRLSTTLQMTDTAKDANGNVVAGATATWTTDNATVATVDAAGLVVARAVGTAHISATVGTVAGIATVKVSTVPVASVSITPHDPTVTVRQTAQLTATPADSAGNPLSGRTITWRSLSTGVATVSSAGLVTGVAAGKAAIQATSEGKVGVDTVTVAAAPVSSVVLSPATSSIYVTQTETITAQVTDANGDPIGGAAVSFTSSKPGVATINATSGVVTGVTPGITTITGTSHGKSGTAAVAVFQVPIASVTIAPSDTTIISTRTAQMRVAVVDSLGRAVASPTVTWSSTPGGRVSSSGLVTPQAGDSGNTIVVVAQSGGKSGSATVHITAPPPVPVSSVIVAPTLDTIFASAPNNMVALSDTTKSAAGAVLTGRTVQWTSSSPVASVSGTGLVSGTDAAAGTATITAAVPTGPSGSATVVVIGHVATVGIAPDTVAVSTSGFAGPSTATLVATLTDSFGSNVTSQRSVTWSSNDPNVATVGSTTGVVTAVAPLGGVTHIIATTPDNMTGTATVVVVP